MRNHTVAGVVAALLLAVTGLARADFEYVYWADSEENAVHRCGLDGSAVETLVDLDLGSVGDVTLDVAGGYMFWTNANLIMRSDLDGNSTAVVVSGASSGWVRELELDLTAGKLYWSDSGTGRIRRANFDGTGIEDLVTTGTDNMRALALDVAGGKMYWKDSGVLWRANLDGTGIESLVTGVQNVVGIDLDVRAGKMYWTDTTQDKIRRANLDGTAVEDFLTGTPAPFGIDVVTELGYVYWTDVLEHSLQRIRLDGTGRETLVTGLPRPWGLEVVPEPASVLLGLLAALGLRRR